MEEAVPVSAVAIHSSSIQQHCQSSQHACNTAAVALVIPFTANSVILQQLYVLADTYTHLLGHVLVYC
jgi:hypothetical protein